MTRLALAARQYAARGWEICPLHHAPAGRCSCQNPNCPSPGKHPRTANGFHDASADPAVIRTWWARWPDANIGFQPGKGGLLVVDLDGPEGEQAAGALGLLAEPTLEVVTGRADGGRHRYYRHPGGDISNVALAPRLDVRADHGYVLLPPSVHPTGRVYRWRGKLDEVAALPARAVALLSGGADESARRVVADQLPAWMTPWLIAGEGSRNQTLTRFVGWAYAMRHDEPTVLSMALGLNATYKPPLAREEVEAIVRSIGTREARKKIRAPVPDSGTGTDLLMVRCAKDITPRSIQWLWRRRLPRSRYVELVGFPGIGKTAAVMDMIARITTDGRWPDGSQGEVTDVVVVAAEDEADDVLVPRLIAAGADLARVHFIDGIHRGSDQLEDLDLSKAIDFVAVARLMKEKRAGLGFLDALDDVLGAKHDGKGNAETRRALGPVRRLARETGACILGLRHPTKRVAVGPALNQGNGSIAYGAVARGSLLVAVDPDDPARRLLLATKSNISRLADTLAFRLECQPDDDEPPKVVWNGTDPRQADEVLADLRAREQENPSDAEREQSKIEQAEKLLQGWLASGWLPVAELESLARQRGVAPTTLRRAKESLVLQYHREGFGKGSRLLCALSGTAPYSPTPADVNEYGRTELSEPAEPIKGRDVSEPLHTRPSHTRPSEKPGACTSMAEGIRSSGAHSGFRLVTEPGAVPMARLLKADRELARIAAPDPTAPHIRLGLSALARARRPDLAVGISAFFAGPEAS